MGRQLLPSSLLSHHDFQQAHSLMDPDLYFSVTFQSSIIFPFPVIELRHAFRSEHGAVSTFCVGAVVLEVPVNVEGEEGG